MIWIRFNVLSELMVAEWKYADENCFESDDLYVECYLALSVFRFVRGEPGLSYGSMAQPFYEVSGCSFLWTKSIRSEKLSNNLSFTSNWWKGRLFWLTGIWWFGKGWNTNCRCSGTKLWLFNGEGNLIWTPFGWIFCSINWGFWLMGGP